MPTGRGLQEVELPDVDQLQVAERPDIPIVLVVHDERAVVLAVLERAVHIIEERECPLGTDDEPPESPPGTGCRRLSHLTQLAGIINVHWL